jgi:hypothetical protein
MTNKATNPEPTMDLRDLFAPAVVRNGALASTLIFGAGVAKGQEQGRDSLTSDAALEARANQTEFQPYTIKSGDFRLLLAPELGFYYNSDISLSSANPLQDFILRPASQITATYPVGKRNLLRIDVNVGYNQYLEHTDLSTVTIKSGSLVSFDLYLGDFWINLHDRFSYTRDPGAEAAIANTAVYGGLANTVGFSVTRDFLNFVPSLGYDHYNFIANSSTYSYTDNGAELLNARAGFRLHPTLITGLEANGSFTTYDQQVLNDNKGGSAGVYADWQAGHYVHLEARGGYAAYFFEQTSLTYKAVDQNAWYLNLTLTHDISEGLSYSVTGGHELRLGISTDTIKDWYFRVSGNWKIVKHLNLLTTLSYENGIQGTTSFAGGGFQEHYDWFGCTIGLSHPITERLKANLDYRFTIRSSNVAFGDYTQNLVGIRLTYLIK